MGSVAQLYWRVKAPSAQNPIGGYDVVSVEHPLPVTTSAMMMAQQGAFAGKYAAGPGALGQGYLGGILVTPSTTSPGPIMISDGGGPPITVFAGGAGSLADLRPFKIDIGAYGDWAVTAGTGLSVLLTGDFT